MSPGLRALRRLGLVASLGLGCYSPPAFTCARASDCDLEGRGACVEGRCAYPDATCTTGYRYSEHAGRTARCAPQPAADAGR